eukprot:TRINITY_DN49363_c0_g1_i1.p1 TRINITY_DN49363_c0_g1~~TRINITY_DN49363_c0_g1_i1.p1  ORF type:complete len:413 (-),score=55.31 TRINITY_DN49363_c0_g1_i1:304-1542(-)
MGSSDSKFSSAISADILKDATKVAACDERITYSGRIVRVKIDGAVMFDWPATSIKFSSSARRIWLQLDGGHNYFNVLINGHHAGVIETKTRSEGFYELPIDTEGSNDLRHFEIQKRTEAKISSFWGGLSGKSTHVVVFYGLVTYPASENPINLHGEHEEGLKRPLIEFLGDSETAGFGNIGPSQPGNPGLKSLLTANPSHQDANQAWPVMVGKSLKTDYHVIAWSGIGVLWNSYCSSDVNFHHLYPRLLATRSDPTSVATVDQNLLSEWTPDIVVVYIGGNDWYTLEGNRSKGLPAEDELIDAFLHFLKQLRAFRSEVDIVILLASPDSCCACVADLKEQAKFAKDMETAWSAAASRFGDDHVFLERVCPNPRIDVSCAEDWGQMGHWSVKGNRKWADAVHGLLQKYLKTTA